MIEQFKKDIDNGLSSSPKTLPSMYFYDKIGDALFVKIMHSEEYYLTRAELDIFQNQTQQMIDQLQLDKSQHFELIELGAGDGLKTKELLKVLSQEQFSFDYLPVDISQNALDQLEKSINEELPKVSIKTQQGDYFKVLETLNQSKTPKVVLFLGSNLGNMSDEMATKFISKLSQNLSENDKLYLGVDLIKPAKIVKPAYNDSEGYTRDFNMNLLRRINNELGANFDLDQFSHQPEYDETEGIAKSFIRSEQEQEVKIEALDKSFHFEEGEKIATEISRKYNDEIVEKVIKNADFKISSKLTDRNNYFANYILNRTKKQ
ncbi:L-histidine N(alpha)-methyltransferase [Brumimicrobium aurantiacum]|uniref:L-histidine N(Alpha)-methyltransferase n=1 Tax=Brumimicrobium aurantiacum TaxID=1737063 RepID=A0A3E1F1F3_9FLAO|nr:L-histidine N(alpha)-methyltransferase [Brumimicrobium aurantiacum]RFC55636.1 L-histidine N(alpha)-methyltransferase [Brumimicrobium aurantiacum]